MCFRVLLGQTGPSVSQESRALLVFEERTELMDVRERGVIQALQGAQERRETLERTVPR